MLLKKIVVILIVGMALILGNINSVEAANRPVVYSISVEENASVQKIHGIVDNVVTLARAQRKYIISLKFENKNHVGIVIDHVNNKKIRIFSIDDTTITLFLAK